MRSRDPLGNNLMGPDVPVPGGDSLSACTRPAALLLHSTPCSVAPTQLHTCRCPTFRTLPSIRTHQQPLTFTPFVHPSLPSMRRCPQATSQTSSSTLAQLPGQSGASPPPQRRAAPHQGQPSAACCLASSPPRHPPPQMCTHSPPCCHAASPTARLPLSMTPPAQTPAAATLAYPHLPCPWAQAVHLPPPQERQQLAGPRQHQLDTPGCLRTAVRRPAQRPGLSQRSTPSKTPCSSRRAMQPRRGPLGLPVLWES